MLMQQLEDVQQTLTDSIRTAVRRSARSTTREEEGEEREEREEREEGATEGRRGRRARCRRMMMTIMTKTMIRARRRRGGRRDVVSSRHGTARGKGELGSANVADYRESLVSEPVYIVRAFMNRESFS